MSRCAAAILPYAAAVIAACSSQLARETGADARAARARAAEPGPHAPSAAARPRHATIRLDTPVPGALVHSPLDIRGQARGSSFFEARFGVELLDARGAVLAQTHADARGEWMTEAFVPFAATLAFAPPETAAGTLVLHKANPSGLPERDEAVRVPVRFAGAAP